MEILLLIIQILSGAGGGAAAGKLFSKKNEGLLVNLGVGVIGGVVFARILSFVVGSIIADVGAISPSVVMASIVGGVVGGGASLMLVGSVGKGPMSRTGR